VKWNGGNAQCTKVFGLMGLRLAGLTISALILFFFLTSEKEFRLL
jgi:hypothetical protein